MRTSHRGITTGEITFCLLALALFVFNWPVLAMVDRAEPVSIFVFAFSSWAVLTALVAVAARREPGKDE